MFKKNWYCNKIGYSLANSLKQQTAIGLQGSTLLEGSQWLPMTTWLLNDCINVHFIFQLLFLSFNCVDAWVASESSQWLPMTTWLPNNCINIYVHLIFQKLFLSFSCVHAWVAFSSKVHLYEFLMKKYKKSVLSSHSYYCLKDAYI